MFILVRGTVRITIKEELIDVLGPGATVGEVAALNGNKRVATVTAESPITGMWISSADLKHLVTDYPVIGERMWKITAGRYAYYLLKEIAPYNKLSDSSFKKEIKKAELNTYNRNTDVDLNDAVSVLVNGSVKDKDKIINAPAVLTGKTYEFEPGAKALFMMKSVLS